MRLNPPLLAIFLTFLSSLSTFGQKPELVVPSGYGTALWNVTISPDKKLVATTDLGNTIKLIDVATGRELRSLVDQSSSVIRSVAFSPDGLLLASGGSNNSVKLWDVKSGTQLRTLTIPTSMGVNPVLSIAFSPDGRNMAAVVMATSANDRSIKIWDVPTGREIHTLDGYATTLSFSPDGSQLVGISLDYELKFWDVGTGRLQNRVNWVDNPFSVVLADARKGVDSIAMAPASPLMRFDTYGRLLIVPNALVLNYALSA